MSTAINGKTPLIVAYVAAHPGCSSDDLEAATGCSKYSGLLCYLVKTGKVHQSGPRSMRRYYGTAEAAAAAHDGLCAARTRRAIETRRRLNVLDNKRKRLKRAVDRTYREAEAAKQKRRTETRRLAQQHPGVRIVVAPPVVDKRFAVEPGFERVITNDWRERRLREAA